MSDGAFGVVYHGTIGFVLDGVADVVSNGALGVYVHLGFIIFFVCVAFGSPSNIITWVPSLSSNVLMASRDWHKMANQVLGVDVASLDEGENVVRVVNYGIGGSINVKEFENAFWNMFEKELHKYKDCLDIVFSRYPFETINVNTTSRHVFSHFIIVL